MSETNIKFVSNVEKQNKPGSKLIIHLIVCAVLAGLVDFFVFNLVGFFGYIIIILLAIYPIAKKIEKDKFELGLQLHMWKRREK